MSLKSTLFTHREKIVYGAHILSGLIAFGFFNSMLEEKYFNIIQGKFIGIGLIGLSLYVFNKFYNGEELKRYYTKMISSRPYIPTGATAQPIGDLPAPPPPVRASIIDQYNQPLTKQTTPSVPEELQEEPAHKRFNIPNFSEGIKTPSELREEREKRRGERINK